MVEEIFLKILISLGIGALIGTEREHRGKGELAQGIRTFMLASLLGLLSTYFSTIFHSFLIFYISFLAVCTLTVLAYMNKIKSKHLGLTTEFAFLITFLLGVLVYFDNFPFYISISLSIFLFFTLASKELLHAFSKHLTKEEIWNFAIFAILSFVVLPILPNKPIDPFNAINPFMIWASIVVVLSLSFVAYILMKIFGAKKGLILSGFLGGIVSSVAVTISMASQAKKNKKILYSAIFSILIASSTMFLRMFFLSTLFNLKLAPFLFFPLATLSILGYFSSLGFLEKVEKEKPKMMLKSPLDFKVALRFGIFFISSLFFVHVTKNYFGEMVIYPIAFITGLGDVDAVTISLSSLAYTSISPGVAVNGIILAALSNTLSKWLLVFWLGNREMASNIGKTFLALMIVGAIILFFI
jgi:uncharacterized membrane protein (DUF4010 family)